MCGIYATHGDTYPEHDLSHRGPDASSAIQIDNTLLMFWRLAINGLEGGMQPFNRHGKFLIANAEIYNHIQLGGIEGYSDCEVILDLIEKYDMFETCTKLDGDFAFVISDGKNLWAARDRVGVRPLFYCYHSEGIAFASEAKALLHFDEEIFPFPPGNFYDPKLDRFVCFEPNYAEPPKYGQGENLHSIVVAAVTKRIINTEKPIGFFLSGGLDSSIIAAVADMCIGTIRTFSIGLEGSPDLVAARKVADHIKSEHTEIVFKPEEGLLAIDDVIWHIESFDTTTVRASIPMYLLSKYISEKTDIKVVLSGEGADELFGGYLYFHGAPDKDAFATETMRLVNDVHLFDVLRADRTTAAHGLELRVPFFDSQLIDYVMYEISPQMKMPWNGYEKYILRKAFEHLLPQDIVWRQKNGMSDAVGYEWRTALKVFGEKRYEKIFKDNFGEQYHLVPYKWMPRWSDATDPSATQLKYFTPHPAHS